VTTTETRVALVTGANRGLGLETSRQLLAQRLRVVLTGRDEDALGRAAATLDPSADRVMPVRMDVVDVDSIKAAKAAVERRFGRVDVVVNNAGVLIAEHVEVLSIPSEAYRRTFETNVFGVIEACRVFVPAMARAGYGRVVNVSSGAGQLRTSTSLAFDR
jgi:NAD(P)-dependent dehydrogenase (short-subunit alcohol dehydrogenase family)